MRRGSREWEIVFDNGKDVLNDVQFLAGHPEAVLGIIREKTHFQFLLAKIGMVIIEKSS
jgi:hypothetical protein